MYDKCEACGNSITEFEDCKLMQVEDRVKAYCRGCFDNKTAKPEIKNF